MGETVTKTKPSTVWTLYTGEAASKSLRGQFSILGHQVGHLYPSYVSLSLFRKFGWKRHGKCPVAFCQIFNGCLLCHARLEHLAIRRTMELSPIVTQPQRHCATKSFEWQTELCDCGDDCNICEWILTWWGLSSFVALFLNCPSFKHSFNCEQKRLSAFNTCQCVMESEGHNKFD